MRKTLPRLSLILATVLALAGCSGTNLLNSITPDSGYAVSNNVVFDPLTGLKLDVYTPPHPNHAPVILFFYAGSWQQSYTRPKEDFRFVGQALAASGYVAVIPDYRTYPQVVFPGFLNDNARAVKWVHANIQHYGGDPNRMVLMGHSSGAYNAAMLALDPEYIKAVGGDRSWIRGMIGLAGPYDFLPITDPVLRVIFGPPENFERTQPILFVDGRNPPMLLMAGQDDDKVQVRNTNNLYDRVRAANGTVEKVIYPEMSHSKIIATVASRLQGESDVMKNIIVFVTRVTSAPLPATDNYGIQTTPQPDPDGPQATPINR